MNREDLIKAIEEMSVLELSQLVKDLEEKFGVSAAAPAMAMPMMAMPGAGAAAATIEISNIPSAADYCQEATDNATREMITS